MELFYREMRRGTNILMRGAEPEGGRWNYDSENRKGFGKSGPGELSAPPRFEPDVITRAVLDLTEKHFPDHPGSLRYFGWPVTRNDALAALEAFVRDRLAKFGPYQDAMWTGTPFAWHSLLSSSLNLKLLDPREVIAATERAYREQRVDLASAEGFIRQVLGWREFMRGVYWLEMPALSRANFFCHSRPLPQWFWTADTRMNCMRETLGQTLALGHAHHIQRLMVVGNFALTCEIDPRQVSDWFLAIYVDAVEWVQLPNTAGMALFANGGRFTSKPYVASGAYINRMSNYCAGCYYRPGDRRGERACPMTVLYWDFIDRHADWLARSPRTSLMVKSLRRLPPPELQSLRKRAREILGSPEAI